MIEVQHATKVFRRGSQEIQALVDVSFCVKPAETLAIQGPSGSGKTTLLTLIGTLDEPTSGSIRLNGTDPWALSDRKRSKLRAEKVGFVFQSYNLIPHLSAWKNVALPLRYAGVGRRERRQRAISALRGVGLDSRIDHLPSQLSGGEEQRVATARAMVASPRLLLADEPTGNLDTETGERLIARILALAECGGSVMVVTHNAAIASLCKRSLGLLDGRLLT
jgi:putative ABC transport system ATP-binding protein